MTRSRLANLVGIAIGVGGLAFVVHRIVRDRAEIADALAAAELGWLAVGAVSGLVAMALIGVNWLTIMRRAGAAAPGRRGMSWFFVGQLGKYVPGGIWPIVGQAELAHRGGTSRRIAYVSTATSMVATFLGAATVAAVAGLISPSDGRVLSAALAIALVASLAALTVPMARSALERVARRATRRELRLPDGRWIVVLVARHLPVWLAFAGMNIFAVAALDISFDTSLDSSLVVELVFVTCVSWMAGFVVVGVPGGIGVREAVFISMTTASLGAGVAVAAAVLSRLVSIAVDLLGAAVSVPIARSAPEEQAPDDRAEPHVLDRYASP
jgi:glycosyltransferase 2 family protein